MKIEALAQFLRDRPDGTAARFDWASLLGDFEGPFRKRYVHRSGKPARDVRCPAGRKGCFQELRKSSVADEWRGVCSRELERCERRTFNKEDVASWLLSFKTVALDLARGCGATGAATSRPKSLWFCGERTSGGAVAELYFGVPDLDGDWGIDEDEFEHGDSWILIVPEKSRLQRAMTERLARKGVLLVGLATGFEIGIDGAIRPKCDWSDMWRSAGELARERGVVSNEVLRTHMDRRFDTLGQEHGALKKENTELKHNLATVLGNMASKVEPEFLQWIFVILAAGSVSGAAKAVGIKGSTFDQKVKAYVAKGGLYATLYSLVAVRRKGLGQKPVVRFDERVAAHQVAASGPKSGGWQELIDGLEGMSDENWDAVRDELVEVAKELMTEE